MRELTKKNHFPILTWSIQSNFFVLESFNRLQVFEGFTLVFLILSGWRAFNLPESKELFQYGLLKRVVLKSIRYLPY